MDTRELLAGAAREDITPPLGTLINGDFLSHYATHIHDSLYAKALVLKTEQCTVALVVVDICVMPKSFVDKVKSLISEQTGIAYTNILLSATHTHAAGSVASVYLSAVDLQYMQKLPALIAAAVSKALQRLRAARTAFGSLEAPEHVRCRRYFMREDYRPFNPVSGDADKVKTNPFGAEGQIVAPVATPDAQVSFLAVQDLDGEWISILANYGLHYVGDWENGTISSDYFGAFSRHLQQLLGAGDAFTGIMSNGTSGDVNIWDFEHKGQYPSGHFEKSEHIGRDIAEKVVRALRDVDWEETPVLSALYEELKLGLRKPSPGELENAEKIIAQSDYRNIEINEQGLRSIYAREQVLLNESPAHTPFPVQAIRVGSGIIGGLGGEIFAATGLWLKAHSPVKKYFSIGLANANAGYLPPANELERGGYETWRSRVSKLEAVAEAKVKTGLLELIHKISQL
jgi:neutral ceramidase